MNLAKSLILAVYPFRSGIKAGNPDLKVSIKNQKFNRNHYLKYCELLGLEGDFFGPLYPHVVMGNLHLDVLMGPQFPFSVLGSIHKSNSIEYYHQLSFDKKYDFEVALSQLRPTEKGIEFELISQVSEGDKICWKGLSTYLKKGPPTKKSKTHSSNPEPDAEELISSWEVPSTMGLQYAKLCQDFNPIHISSLGAKLFGLPSKIAHGLMLWGQMLNKIDSFQFIGRKLEVNFKGPIPLGSSVALLSNSERTILKLYRPGDERPAIVSKIF